MTTMTTTEPVRTLPAIAPADRTADLDSRDDRIAALDPPPMPPRRATRS
jgi:hypothetical protein